MAGYFKIGEEKVRPGSYFNISTNDKLVEIINAYDTSEDTIETGKAVAERFGKLRNWIRTKAMRRCLAQAAQRMRSGKRSAAAR